MSGTRATQMPAGNDAPARHWLELRGREDLVRERLYARLQERPVLGVSQAEIDQHFAGMPGRYWQGANKAELIWGLETVHNFLQRAGTEQASRATVVADW